MTHRQKERKKERKKKRKKERKKKDRKKEYFQNEKRRNKNQLILTVR